MNIARTTLSSKILTQHKDYFSNLAVDAVLRLKVKKGEGVCTLRLPQAPTIKILEVDSLIPCFCFWVTGCVLQWKSST